MTVCPCQVSDVRHFAPAPDQKIVVRVFLNQEKDGFQSLRHQTQQQSQKTVQTIKTKTDLQRQRMESFIPKR